MNQLLRRVSRSATQTSTSRWLWTFILAGLILRTIFALVFHAEQVEGLTVSYFSSARDLAAGDPFLVERGVEILHPYGYSVLVLLVQVFTGSNDVATLYGLTGLQVVLDSGAIALAFVAARNVHSRTTGLWVAGAYALNPLIILAVTQPMPESLSPALMAAFLAAGSMMWRQNPRWALAAGVTCGVAAQFRSEFLLLPVVLVAYAVLLRRLRRETTRLVVMVAVVAAFMMPMVVGTWVQTGTPRLNTTNAGGTMWQALGERPDNPWGLKLGDQYVAQEAARLGFPSPWGPEANEHFKNEFKQDIASHPEYYADLVLRTRIPGAFSTPTIRWNYAQYAVGIWQLEESKVRYSELRQAGLWTLLREDPRLLIINEEVGLLIRGLMMLSFASLAVYVAINLRRPERFLLLGLPFAYFVLTLSLIKFVEPRQFFVLLTIYTFAFGAVAHAAWKLMTRRRGSVEREERDSVPVGA